MVRIIVVLLILVATVSAQSPRRDSIQTALIEQIGMASITGTARAVTRAYIQVCKDYDAYEKVDTVHIDSASGWATVPTDLDRIENVNLILSDETNSGTLKLLKSLVGLPQDTLFDRIGEELEGTTDRAKQDYYNIKDRSFYTYPRWLGRDSLLFEITYYALGAELDSAADSIQTAPGFYDAVFYYACAEMQQQRGQWTDALNYRKLVWALFGPPKGGIPQ